MISVVLAASLFLRTLRYLPISTNLDEYEKQITYHQEEKCIACSPPCLTNIYIGNDNNWEEARRLDAFCTLIKHVA